MKAYKNTSTDMTGWGPSTSLSSIKSILSSEILYFREMGSLLRNSLYQSANLWPDWTTLGGYESTQRRRQEDKIQSDDFQVLAQQILKMIFQLITPHYILIVLTTYIYKPRLTHMISQFKDEIIRRNTIIQHLKMHGFN